MEKFNKKEHSKELTFDMPIEYNGLIFSPVIVEQYDEFYTFISCLLQDKNSIPDIKIIQMSYLDYVFYLSDIQETSYMLSMLSLLIGLCTNVDTENIKFYINEKGSHVLIIDDNEFDKNQFMYMREIICAQNDVDLTIFDLDPRVRGELQKTIDFKDRTSSFEMATLEEQIICIVISSSLSIEDIKILSLRKFKKILNRIDHKMTYEIYTLGTLCGNVVLKEEIPHWLTTLEKDKFDKLISSYEEVQKKVNMSNTGI